MHVFLDGSKCLVSHIRVFMSHELHHSLLGTNVLKESISDLLAIFQNNPYLMCHAYLFPALDAYLEY